MRDTGVGVLDVAAYYVGPDTRVEDFVPVFDIAVMLGATFVCTSGYDPDESRLAEAAAARGICLALEAACRTAK